MDLVYKHVIGILLLLTALVTSYLKFVLGLSGDVFWTVMSIAMPNIISMTIVVTIAILLLFQK